MDDKTIDNENVDSKKIDEKSLDELALVKFGDSDLDILLKKDINIEFDGDFLVSGKKVAEILDYSNTRDAINNHVYDDDKYLLKNSNVDLIDFRKIANRGETFINESGLYALIFGSQKQEARLFKRWVTSELLPTVRKTGGFIGSTTKFIDYHFQELDNKDKMIIYHLLKSKDNLRKEVDEQKKVINEQEETIKITAPKAEKYDAFLNFNSSEKIGVFAKSLNLGPNKTFKFLRKQKILMNGKGPGSIKNVPYQKHIDAGHFEVKHIIVNKDRPKEKQFQTTITLITTKGMNYIYKRINDADAWDELKSK